MIYYNAQIPSYCLIFDGESIPLYNKINRQWEFSPKCKPSDYVSLGGNTLVLSHTDKRVQKYLSYSKELLNNESK